MGTPYREDGCIEKLEKYDFLTETKLELNQ